MGKRKQKPRLRLYQCKGARCRCESCLRGNAEAARQIKERIRAEGLWKAGGAK